MAVDAVETVSASVIVQLLCTMTITSQEEDKDTGAMLRIIPQLQCASTSLQRFD